MMKFALRALFLAAAALSLVAAVRTVNAQSEVGYQLRYNSGQPIQPIFEGWSKNPDGTFTMHFGYLNRNYVEEVHIPLGQQNNIDPGGPDRGQPTYFYPRVNRRMFNTVVPKDFGKKELIWTLNFRGKSLRAVGWLQPDWEVDSSGGAGRPTSAGENKPPALTIETTHRVTLPGTLVLAATVADDGLPKPRPPGALPRRGSRPWARRRRRSSSRPRIRYEAPINVPQVRLNPRGGMIPPRPPPGLTLGYTIWRGPAAVKFEPQFAVVKDGKATTTLTFTQPGEYVLRARATDGALSDQEELKVTVVAAPTTQP